MSADITQAAISYFGLPDNAQMVEGGPVGSFAFVIGPLTEDQMRGIADRMKALAEFENPRPKVYVPHAWVAKREVPPFVIPLVAYGDERAVAWKDLRDNQKHGRQPMCDHIEPEMRTSEELRAEYASMTVADKAKFGSFKRYEAYALQTMAADDAIEPSEGAGGRKVQHVDVPVDEVPAELPDAVWVHAKDLNDNQLPLVSDRKVEDWVTYYLLQVSMLTDEQRAKYVAGGA